MQQNKQIQTFLAPSWISSLIGITAGVLLTAGIIILDHYQGSQLRQDIFEASSKTPAQQSTYNTVASNFAHSHILGVAPLFIIWAFVGLAVYYLTISIVSVLQQATDLRSEMNYVHTSRQALLRQLLLQFAIRLIALAGWFLFIMLTLRVALPYALALSSIAANGYTVMNLLYAVLAVLVICIDVYIHALFLRLIAQRTRLFN